MRWQMAVIQEKKGLVEMRIQYPTVLSKVIPEWYNIVKDELDTQERCYNGEDGSRHENGFWRKYGLLDKVSSTVQLIVMGWQMVAIMYERDRARRTLLPNYNTYGRFDIPSYYESYWKSPEETFLNALLLIQLLCLLSAVFLFFSSISLIYGIRNKCFIYPWFICILSSILTSLAYCITWWTGGFIRDYWLMITIGEMIAVIINIYCVIVVATCHRKSDPVEKMDVRKEINAHLETIKGLLEHYEKDELEQGPPPYLPLAQSVCPTCSRPEVHKRIEEDSENSNVLA